MPTTMITINKGNGGNREEMEKWFQRAMKNNPANINACIAKMDWLEPRWHGGDKDMLEFGQLCRNQSLAWGVGIPLQLIDAYLRESQYHRNPEDFQKFIRDPEMMDEIKSAYKQYFKYLPEDRAARSAYACQLSRSGHFEDAYEQFKMIGRAFLHSKDSFFKMDYVVQAYTWNLNVMEAKPFGTEHLVPGGWSTLQKPEDRSKIKAEPFPAEFVAAWRKAGAQVEAGWMAMDKFGELFFRVRADQAIGSNVVPAFRMLGWHRGVLGKLPKPDQPFGLEISGAPLAESDMEDLGAFKQLGMLNLSYSSIPVLGFKELANLDNLIALKLNFTGIKDPYLKALVGLKKLTLLDLKDTVVSEAGLKELLDLKQLTSLNLRNTKFKAEAIKQLAALKDLTSLDLGGTDVTDVSVEDIVKLQELRWLGLSEGALTDHSAKVLAELKQLTVLDLSHTQITDLGLKALSALNQLAAINLDSTQVTDAGMKELVKLNSMRRVFLGHTKITDEGFKELSAFKNLSFLDLNSTKITDKGLKNLETMKSIKTLNLGNTAVTDEGVKELEILKNLAVLDLPEPRCRIKQPNSLPRCLSLHGLTSGTQTSRRPLRQKCKKQSLDAL